MPSLDIRQAQLPSCVVSCIGNADIGSCSSLLDYACICRSSDYQRVLAQCFSDWCSGNEAQLGLQFGQERCAAIGITVTAQLPSATGTGPSATAGGDVTPTTVDVTGTPSSWIEPPVLYEQTLLNVQAIMSSICLALLLAAVALGVLSCRARLKRERGQTTSQWSGAGTFGDQTKFDAGASRFGVTSRAGPSSQTDTFMSGISDFRQTVSFSSATGHLPYDKPRFTNRMTVEEEQEEEWELKDRAVGAGSSGSTEDEGKRESKLEVVEEEVPTPTTAASGMDDGDDRQGSQETLNQVQTLGKHGRAI